MDDFLKWACAVASGCFLGFIGFVFNHTAGWVLFMIGFMLTLWDCYKK